MLLIIFLPILCLVAKMSEIIILFFLEFVVEKILAIQTKWTFYMRLCGVIKRTPSKYAIIALAPTRNLNL